MPTCTMRRTTWASQNLRCESTPERARQHWVRRKGIAWWSRAPLVAGFARPDHGGRDGRWISRRRYRNARVPDRAGLARTAGGKEKWTAGEMRASTSICVACVEGLRVPDESLHERHSKCVRHSKWEPDTNTLFCCMGCIRMPCVARRSAWRPCLVQSEAVLPRPKTAYGWPVTIASAEKGHGAAHGGRWEAPGRRLRASVPSAAARDASYDDARVGENELHQHLPP